VIEIAKWVMPQAVIGTRYDPMTDPEWESLWELAVNRQGRLGYRFVEEASRTPVTTRQLRDRAAIALAAAVGLDELRRVEVESLLVARLEDPALRDGHKVDLRIAACAWDGFSASAAARPVRQLIETMEHTDDLEILSLQAEALSAVAARMDAKVAAQAATALLHCMTKYVREQSIFRLLAHALELVAGRMDSVDAAASLSQATSAFAKSNEVLTDFYASVALVEAQRAMASRLGMDDAARAATTLVQALKNTKEDHFADAAFRASTLLLSALEPRMDRHAAQAVAATIVLALNDARNPHTVMYFAEALTALADHLDA
jgi:hypothetical protein